MFIIALTNILGPDNREVRPTEILLMEKSRATSLCVMRWRIGALSGSDLAHKTRCGYHKDVPA